MPFFFTQISKVLNLCNSIFYNLERNKVLNVNIQYSVESGKTGDDFNIVKNLDDYSQNYFLI